MKKQEEKLAAGVFLVKDKKFLIGAVNSLDSQLKEGGVGLSKEFIESLRLSFVSFDNAFSDYLTTMFNRGPIYSKASCTAAVKIALSDEKFELYKKDLEKALEEREKEIQSRPGEAPPKVKTSDIKKCPDHIFLVKINEYLYKDLDQLCLPIAEKNTREFVVKASRNALIGMCENYVNELEDSLKKAQEEELKKILMKDLMTLGHDYEREF